MSDNMYPTSLADIPVWSHANGVTTSEANVRFMEFVVLTCIASSPITASSMVFKGGNALRFAYRSPRSTKDLDFSVAANGLPDDADKIRDILNQALRYAERRFDVKAKCQRVKRNPMNRQATWPTYDIAIGYQLRSDPYFHNFETRNVATVIPVEVSLNDLVCETAACAGLPSLRVCSLEDILAEKLRSLLQQKSRHRNRFQDVYDIARYASEINIDPNKVAEYLKQKSRIRGIDVRKSSFDEETRRLAAQDYDSRIHQQAPRNFIPFEDAWQNVLSLVHSLDIPD